MRSCILAMLICSLPAHGQSACSNANFEPGAMSETSLKSEFKSAVMRLQVPGSTDSGTGYLIDSVNGYIITAFHVVQTAQANTPIEVVTPFSGLRGTKLIAKLIKSLATLQQDGTLSGTDLALLKLDNASLVKDIRPVDVGLRFPSPSSVLYAMGYPKLDEDEPNKTFTEQSVELMASPDDGSIEVRQAIFGGNSGGPLIDPSGSVIGTCRESIGIGAIVSRYIPMSDAESLLDLLPLSARMANLDDQVKTGHISEADLKDILVKSSTTPTNVELYTWARHVMSNHDQYTAASTRALLKCQIKALMQRGLDDLVIELSTFGDPTIVADANISVAEQEIERGRPLSAQKHVEAAQASYLAANDQVGSARAAMVSTRVQLAMGSIAAADKQSSTVLANIDKLPLPDKAAALVTAANIDLSKGTPAAAIGKFTQASQFFVADGKPSRAADILVESATASLKVNKPLDAAASLRNAISLYQGDNNKLGEAESVYKLGDVQSVLGNNTASKTSFTNYLTLAPDGIHAPEVKELLKVTQF